MMKRLYVCLVVVTFAAFAFGSGVSVSTPTPGVTLQSPVHFVATATTACSKGISAIGIYTAPFQLAYVVNGSSLDTTLTLSAGNYDTVVQEWDNCGGASKTAVPITVTASGNEGVYVTSPADNSNVGSGVHFSATA